MNRNLLIQTFNLSLLLIAGLSIQSCSFSPRVPDEGPLPPPDAQGTLLPEIEPEPIFEELLPDPLTQPYEDVESKSLPQPAVLSQRVPDPIAQPTNSNSIEILNVEPSPISSLPEPESKLDSLEAEEDPLKTSLEDQYLRDQSELLILRKKIEGGTPISSAEKLQFANLKKRMISRLFIGGKEDLSYLSTLMETLELNQDATLSMDLLQAAFYEELGLSSKRDAILSRLPKKWHQVIQPDGFKVENFSVVSHYSGYQQVTKLALPLKFGAGDLISLYGEFSHFNNTPLSGSYGKGQRYRRAFSAYLCLKQQDGDFIHRSQFLNPGTSGSEEISNSREKPVHFYGQYRLPTQLPPGRYHLELKAFDLEGEQETQSVISFSVGRAR